MAFDVKGFQQPDYQVNPVAGNKYAPQDGMTQLSNILDYQKKQATLGSDIAKSQAESQKSVTGAQSEQLALATKKMNVIRQAQVAHITDPIVTRAASDPNFAQQPDTIKHIQNLINEQGQTAIDQGIDPNTVKQQLMPYHQIAQSQPQQFQQFLKSRLIAGLDTQAQASLNSLTSAGGQPAIYNPVQGTLSAAEFPGQTPQAGTQAGAQAMPRGVTSAQMEAPEYSQPVKPTYEVRKAGQPYAPAPTEVADREAGNAYKNNLIESQSNLTTNRRNVDEVIKQAREIEKSSILPETGPVGAIKRKIADITGDPKYKQLSKDLANAQLSNMKALGTIKTNEGLQAQAAANGDITYPPDVLISIANRTKADQTNVDMQAIAAKKYSDQFGDANMNSFKQMWSKNADSKIFELHNIFNNPDMTDKEKDEARAKLIGNNPKTIKEFKDKWNNIQKLEKYGTL